MKLIVRNIHKYLSFFISVQLLLWTVSGIYFAFNKIELVRGEQYRLTNFSDINLGEIEIDIPKTTNLEIKKQVIIKNFLKDHRVFMMSCVAALTLGGNFKIYDKKSINSSFPNFLDLLKKLGAKFNNERLN